MRFIHIGLEHSTKPITRQPPGQMHQNDSFAFALKLTMATVFNFIGFTFYNIIAEGA
jgi:hypothetical protein